MKFNGITRAIARTALHAKKQSPHIFFGAGLTGVVAGGVLACRATLQLEHTLDEIKADLSVVREARDTTGTELQTAPESVYYGVMTRVYADSAWRMTRLYGPAVLITGIGIACLTGSHVQLTRRNAALQATLVAVQASYDRYRKRVSEEIGAEKEEAIYRDLVGIGEGDTVDGRDPQGHSTYARVFDETNPRWKPDPELNRITLKSAQAYANQLLQHRGHVFLNEVYDALGFDHSRQGAVVGWVISGDGDNYIDFGVMEVRNNRFLNGLECSVWLDFNVDGVIFDLI